MLPNAYYLIGKQCRLIAINAWPVLVAQLASISMMLVDTALLGHVGATELAAAAVGGGIYISVVMALVGILQSVAPLVAHQRGAANDAAIASIFRQGIWLAGLLAVPGIILMRFPDPLLALSAVEPAVEAQARAYLQVMAWGVPAALGYRTFHAFATAVGHPRPLMLMALVGVALHAPQAWLLLHFSAVTGICGAMACGLSSVIVAYGNLMAATAFLWRADGFRRYALLSTWEWPRPARFKEMISLGLPMGVSSFVEITSFTLIALFVARLGAEAVAAHRIVANLVALAYMLPLALAVATLSEAGRALGAGEPRLARHTVQAGLLLALALSVVTASATWYFAQPVIALFTNTPAVTRLALALVIYVAVYQLFDAVQTVAGFCLRAYKIAVAPMLIHAFSFWLIGLGGGMYLAFAEAWQLGVTGFWVAAVASVVAAAGMLGILLWRVARPAKVVGADALAVFTIKAKNS